MASLELSSGVMSGLPTRIIYPGSGCSQTQCVGQVYPYPLLPLSWSGDSAGYPVRGIIGIYQGTVPTDFSGLTTPTSRSADLLVQWDSTNSNNFSMSINVTVNPAIINSAYQVATASGTATWFRWYTRVSDGGFVTPYVATQIIGTVGATGSGADLEIPSTAIVSGRAYRIQNLRILFPSSWSY